MPTIGIEYLSPTLTFEVPSNPPTQLYFDEFEEELGDDFEEELEDMPIDTISIPIDTTGNN